MSLKEFLQSIDFKKIEKLSAVDIGYDEELDLVLRTNQDDQNESGDENLSGTNSSLIESASLKSNQKFEHDE